MGSSRNRCFAGLWNETFLHCWYISLSTHKETWWDIGHVGRGERGNIISVQSFKQDNCLCFCRNCHKIIENYHKLLPSAFFLPARISSTPQPQTARTFTLSRMSRKCIALKRLNLLTKEEVTRVLQPWRWHVINVKVSTEGWGLDRKYEVKEGL